MTEYLVLAAILLVALGLFWTQRVPTDITALLVMLALIVPWPRADGEWRGILDYKEGFSGFGSPAVVMVAGMFVLGRAIVRTGAAEALGGRLLRAAARQEWLLQMAVLAASTVTSMFVNDTTVVLVFLPLILSVCEEKKLSPSRYLILAAYGSLLGGQWTLIGTRSNIIISDYLRMRSGEGIGFFAFTPIAAVVFVAAAAYFLLVGRHLLPSGRGGDSTAGAASHYVTEATVTEGSGAAGRALGDLPWAERDDLSVVEILRQGRSIPLRSKLEAGDELILTGRVGTITELLRSSDFEIKQELDEATLQSAELVTVDAFVPSSSRYVGSTLGALGLGRTHGFSVMGLSREGRRVSNQPSRLPLRGGDSLLLLGSERGLPSLEHDPNLILLGHRAVPALGRRKAIVVALLLAGIIGTAITGTLAVPVSVPLAAVAAILLGCVSVKDAYESVSWPAIVTVAGMIPFGLALETTGAAEGLARFAVESLSGRGPVVILAGVLLLGVLLTQIIENAAVAIILAPVVYEVARGLDLSPEPFMIGLAISISAAFCTPVAHESTILVMRPGRYEFKHYFQIGTALALLTWIITSLLAPRLWELR